MHAPPVSYEQSQTIPYQRRPLFSIQLLSIIGFVVFSALLFIVETIICYKLPTASALGWTLIGGGIAQSFALLANFSKKKPSWCFAIIATIFILNNILSGALLLNGTIGASAFASKMLFSNLSKLVAITIVGGLACCGCCTCTVVGRAQSS